MKNELDFTNVIMLTGCLLAVTINVVYPVDALTITGAVLIYFILAVVATTSKNEKYYSSIFGVFLFVSLTLTAIINSII